MNTAEHIFNVCHSRSQMITASCDWKFLASRVVDDDAGKSQVSDSSYLDSVLLSHLYV